MNENSPAPFLFYVAKGCSMRMEMGTDDSVLVNKSGEYGMKWTLILSAVCVALASCDRQPVVDAKQMTENLKKLERCVRDPRDCEGGFIKKPGRILILTSCKNNCREYEEGVENISYLSKTTTWFPGVLEYVRLPWEPGWEKAAVAYARQFVRKQ